MSPGVIDAELIKKLLGDEKPITTRYADTLVPVFEKVKNDIKNMAKTDEDVISYILFPQIAEKFFKKKEEPNEVKVSYTIMKV